MTHHILEFDEQCKACKGSGLYFGLAEKDGAAVICHRCKGTGCNHVRIEYDDFEGRKEPPKKCERVFQFNAGICIGEGNGHRLEDFGGMPYNDWKDGKPFPPKSEDRKHTCPAWWYQTADYDRKPRWRDDGRTCIFSGSFSKCEHFHEKEGCWRRWDEEYKNDNA